MMDRTDYQILNLLQDDSRCTLRRMGDLVGLTPPAVSERIRRMEESGVIRGYHIDIDRTKLDCNITGFISVALEPDKYDKFCDFCASQSAIISHYHVVSSTRCSASPCATRSSSTSFSPSSRSSATRAPRSSSRRSSTARRSRCRNTTFPLHQAGRLWPTPHKKTCAVKGKFCTDSFVATSCHASACPHRRASAPHKICSFSVQSSFANEFLR